MSFSSRVFPSAHPFLRRSLLYFTLSILISPLTLNSITPLTSAAAFTLVFNPSDNPSDSKSTKEQKQGQRYLVDGPSGTSFHTDTKTGRVKDRQGRERFFHGTNVVYKLFPFIPDYGLEYEAEGSNLTATWSPKTSFTAKQDMNLLYSMGFNSIRLNVPWAAVEPFEAKRVYKSIGTEYHYEYLTGPGSSTYNETYLSKIRALITQAGKEFGIFSIVDMHQDAFSSKLCGTGFPSWTVPDVHDKSVYRWWDNMFHGGKRGTAFPSPLATSFELLDNGKSSTGIPIEDPSGLYPGRPNRTLCHSFNHYNFPMFHLTFQTSMAYEEVYQNYRNKLTKFSEYWGKVAESLGGKIQHKFEDAVGPSRLTEADRGSINSEGDLQSSAPFMLGYELINEPFSGDLYANPLSLVPGYADRFKIQPMYDMLAEAIRERDGDRKLGF